jgi:recombination protein RecA
MPPTKKKTVSKSPESAKTLKQKDATDSYIESLKKQGMLGNITKEIKFIPTGSWVVNRLIGDGSHTNAPGGFPRGYITEVFGDEGCGKTTLALHACQQAQLLGERVIYADFEHSLRTQFQYIKNIGLDLSPAKFIHLTPTCLEDGVRQIGRGLKELRPGIIVVDSVTTMLPKSSFENNADDTIQIGLHAKLTGTFLNWMSSYLEECDTALVLLNQLRSAIKGKYDRGPEEVTSGGRAPRFFSTIRLELRVGLKQEIMEKSIITGISEKKKINQTVKATVIKNKLDVPYKSGPLFIAFGQGIDNVMSLVMLAINKNIIKKSGGWYEFTDPSEKYSFKVQGVTQIKKHLEDHPEVLEAMKPYLLPSEDTNEMIRVRDELEARGMDNLTEDEKENLKRLRTMNLDSDENFNPDLEADDESLKELEGMMGGGGSDESGSEE